jgi:hypothetical protein
MIDVELRRCDVANNGDAAVNNGGDGRVQKLDGRR